LKWHGFHVISLNAEFFGRARFAFENFNAFGEFYPAPRRRTFSPAQKEGSFPGYRKFFRAEYQVRRGII
jgi:hypothetical protein